MERHPSALNTRRKPTKLIRAVHFFTHDFMASGEGMQDETMRFNITARSISGTLGKWFKSTASMPVLSGFWQNVQMWGVGVTETTALLHTLQDHFDGHTKALKEQIKEQSYPRRSSPWS